MNKNIFVLVVFSVCLSFSLQAEKTKQALKALEKNDFAKVEEILLKSESKELNNPATSFVWARLYTTPLYEQYDIDTAHYYIVLACQDLKQQNEDYLEELDDAGLFEYDLTNEKMAIDSLAWHRAKEFHSIVEYNHFIGNYPDAIGYSEAILARDQLVFDEVTKLNVWQMYQKFMSEFPNAEQLGQAKNRYDKLIFEEKTSSGEVRDYIQFLKDEPGTPYRFHIESRIFSHHMALLDPQAIRDFMDKYQNKTLAHRALSMLYYLDNAQYAEVLSNDQQAYRAFQDSVKSVALVNEIPLTPLFDGEFYAFIDSRGTAILSDSIAKIDSKFYCGNHKADWLHVQQQGQMRVINRRGDEMVGQAEGEVKDLGLGLLAVEQDGVYGIYHKGGFELLSPAYEELTLVEDRFFLFTQEGKMGVMNINGEAYVPASYDDIYSEGQFWVFQKDEVFGVSNSGEFLSATEQSPFTIDLKYEEVELINSEYIIGYLTEGEELIGGDLKVKTEAGTKRINTKYESWVVEQANGYQVFDKDLGQLSEVVYEDVLQNEEWLGLQQYEKWLVYNRTIYDEAIIGVDSLKLLGQDIAIVFRGESGMAIFPNKRIVDFTDGEYLQAISSGTQSESHFLVIQRDGSQLLYRDGQKLFDYACDELGYISDSVFSVKKGDKYGAVDSHGQLIMNIRYDAISLAEDEVSDVLLDGSFGAYNFRERVLLRLEFGEKLGRYNDSMFLVKEEGKYGLLDRFNEMILEPTYDEIKYWSDTTFLGKINGQWQLVNVLDQSVLLTEVDYFEYVKDTIEEKIILIRTESGYGIYHTTKGLIVPTVFHDVINLGDADQQLYFTETAVPEAGYYVVVYYDSDGNKLHATAYTEQQYERVVCDQ